VSVLLDTSYLLALHAKRDVNHITAEALKGQLKNKEFGQLYISDYIFDEFVTHLRARSYPKADIQEIGSTFLEGGTFQMLQVNSSIFSKAWELFKKYEVLSFTDCTTAILAEEFGIRHIASFDAGFDRVSHLKRLH